MSKFSAINGFTKSDILEAIMSDFTGVSLDAKGSCMYRGSSGAMCAVGLFIPNEMYSPSMENKTVDRLLRDHEELISVLPLEGKGLLALQDVHDRYQECYDDSDKENIDLLCKNKLLKWVENNVIGECPLILSRK